MFPSFPSLSFLGFVDVVGCSSTLLSLLSLSFPDPKSVAKLSLSILTPKFMSNSHFAINSKNPMPKLYFIATVSSLCSTKHAMMQVKARENCHISLRKIVLAILGLKNPRISRFFNRILVGFFHICPFSGIFGQNFSRLFYFLRIFSQM